MIRGHVLPAIAATLGSILAVGSAHAAEPAPAAAQPTPYDEAAPRAAPQVVPVSPDAAPAQSWPPAAFPQAAPYPPVGAPPYPQASPYPPPPYPPPPYPPPPYPPPARPYPYPPPEVAHDVPKSYSGQIVLADLAGILLTGVAAGSPSLQKFGIAPYLLASPIVHAAHGNWGRAAGSLGLHVGAPLVGVLLGLALANADCKGNQGDDFCGLGEVVLGVLLGIVAATTIDAAVLARETPPGPPTVTASLTPTIAVGRSGSATVGLGGRF